MRGENHKELTNKPFQPPFLKIVKHQWNFTNQIKNPNLVVVTIAVYWFYNICRKQSRFSCVYIFFRCCFNMDHCFVTTLTCMQRIDGFATIPSSKKHTNHLKNSQQKEECVQETSVLKKKMRLNEGF